jgi:hypothetical protein
MIEVIACYSSERKTIVKISCACRDCQNVYNIFMLPEFKMIPSAIKNKAWLLTKEVYKRTYLKPLDKQMLGFIVGCQRSGTTMLNKAFDNDLRSKTYGEFGLAKGFGCGTPTRLLPYDEISQIFSKEKAPFLIVKPLVESQNIVQLLDYFPNS